MLERRRRLSIPHCEARSRLSPNSWTPEVNSLLSCPSSSFSPKACTSS